MKTVVTNILTEGDRDRAVALFQAMGGAGDAVYNAAEHSLTLEIDDEMQDIADGLSSHLLDEGYEPAEVVLTVKL